MNLHLSTLSGILACFAFGNTHAGNTDYDYGYGQPVQRKTIFDVISGSRRFDILESALKRTGLDDVLDGQDFYTLLAPTDGVSSTLST